MHSNVLAAAVIWIDIFSIHNCLRLKQHRTYMCGLRSASASYNTTQQHWCMRSWLVGVSNAVITFTRWSICSCKRFFVQMESAVVVCRSIWIIICWFVVARTKTEQPISVFGVLRNNNIRHLPLSNKIMLRFTCIWQLIRFRVAHSWLYHSRIDSTITNLTQPRYPRQ